MILSKITDGVISKMKNNLIISASGWRGVFAKDGKENSRESEIDEKDRLMVATATESFVTFISNFTQRPALVVARDNRPTSPAITEAVIRTLLLERVQIMYTGISSAPETYNFAKRADGFIYISASHNPIGHNGLKFGLNTGGVINKKETEEVRAIFLKKMKEGHSPDIDSIQPSRLERVYKKESENKRVAKKDYHKLLKRIVFKDSESEKTIRKIMKEKASHITVVADFNGSSRAWGIDKEFVQEMGFNFLSYNEHETVHGIIPEGKNLKFLKEKVSAVAEGSSDTVIGYACDADGDRGNIVYYDSKAKEAKIIKAQDVLALCVLCELSLSIWRKEALKTAVAVNCGTTMAISKIANTFKAQVFTAEVGEANVVNLGDKKRKEGYSVPILGEGSNGGNITYPSRVRDPLATLTDILKLLAISDNDNKDIGLFHIWLYSQNKAYIDNFSLSDIISSLPPHTTTEVTDEKAQMNIKKDAAELKRAFRSVFSEEWNKKKAELEKKWGITSYRTALTNGTEEVYDAEDWGNGTGGLKIVMYGKTGEASAFMWMRPSGTERILRLLVDLAWNDNECERELLSWFQMMLSRSEGL